MLALDHVAEPVAVVAGKVASATGYRFTGLEAPEIKTTTPPPPPDADPMTRIRWIEGMS